MLDMAPDPSMGMRARKDESGMASILFQVEGGMQTAYAGGTTEAPEGATGEAAGGGGDSGDSVAAGDAVADDRETDTETEMEESGQNGTNV